MKIRITSLQAFILGAGVVLAPEAWAKDKDVSLKECPPPVQAVIQDYTAKGGALEEIGLDEKKKSGGSPVYEAKFTLADGNRVEVHITPSGQVVLVEKKKPKKD